MRFARACDAQNTALNILGPHPEGKLPYEIVPYHFVERETQDQDTEDPKNKGKQGFHDALLEDYLNAAGDAPAGSLNWLLKWYAGSLDEALSRLTRLEEEVEKLQNTKADKPITWT